MRRKNRSWRTGLAVLAVLAAAACSGDAKVAEMNQQAIRESSGVNEQNFERALVMEKATDDLNRVHDQVEGPMDAPPEDMPSR